MINKKLLKKLNKLLLKLLSKSPKECECSYRENEFYEMCDKLSDMIDEILFYKDR